MWRHAAGVTVLRRSRRHYYLFAHRKPRKHGLKFYCSMLFEFYDADEHSVVMRVFLYRSSAQTQHLCVLKHIYKARESRLRHRLFMLLPKLA